MARNHIFSGRGYQSDNTVRQAAVNVTCPVLINGLTSPDEHKTQHGSTVEVTRKLDPRFHLTPLRSRRLQYSI